MRNIRLYIPKLGLTPEFRAAAGLKSGISRDMWDTRFLLPQGEVSAESLSRDIVSTVSVLQVPVGEVVVTAGATLGRTTHTTSACTRRFLP